MGIFGTIGVIAGIIGGAAAVGDGVDKLVKDAKERKAEKNETTVEPTETEEE